VGKDIPMIWRPLNNLVKSLKTYRLLSPDPSARQQVNQWLASRPCLNCEEWFMFHWTPPAVGEAFPKPLIEFVYHRLHDYSGLRVGCICPGDRLLDDLRFPAVCWFDWGLTLCDDFQTSFGTDISETFDESQFVTCADLIHFLRQELKAQGNTHLQP
jgi:hypothetical protein